MKAQIGIAEEHRRAAALALNKVLADEFVLYVKTLNAHWNVEGADFSGKHLFFEGQYGQLESVIDEVAERVRSLGHYAQASLKDFLALTQFSEDRISQTGTIDYVEELLDDHERLIVGLRNLVDQIANGMKDVGTADFLTGLMEKHEKMAWMLRAHKA